jgi:TnpA family transposase
VLDEILDNETELPIEVHMTDTAGDTELIFALFDLLGLQFSPRIRDMADQQLYRVHRGVRYEHIETLLSSTIKSDLILGSWDDLVRLAASFEDGLGQRFAPGQQAPEPPPSERTIARAATNP